jgi:hypothetical protein
MYRRRYSCFFFFVFFFLLFFFVCVCVWFFFYSLEVRHKVMDRRNRVKKNMSQSNIVIMLCPQHFNYTLFVSKRRIWGSRRHSPMTVSGGNVEFKLRKSNITKCVVYSIVLRIFTGLRTYESSERLVLSNFNFKFTLLFFGEFNIPLERFRS